MKKLLFLLALCFSVGAMAETSGSIDLYLEGDLNQGLNLITVQGYYINLNDSTQTIPFFVELHSGMIPFHIPPKQGYAFMLTKTLYGQPIPMGCSDYFGIYNNESKAYIAVHYWLTSSIISPFAYCTTGDNIDPSLKKK